MTEYVIPNGTPFPDAIRDLVLERLPDADFRFNGDQLTSRLLTPHLRYGWDGEPLNPWAEAEQLAEVCGMRLKLRRNRVTAYVPWYLRLKALEYKQVILPLRRLSERYEAWRNPPIEYPDPDYGD
jgi:hypothetical protein